MSYSWKTCPAKVKDFVDNLQLRINERIGENVVGSYLHGSLAMGGFNPSRSDIDLLFVTKDSLAIEEKRDLARILLDLSNFPYPVELSILHAESLRSWNHPCPFEFHYSEFWRGRYKDDLHKHTFHYLNEEKKVDPDLAAHITILHHRGICLRGEPIDNVFPPVPKSDYIASIMGDFEDCLANIEDDPIYCTLNLLRVYWYLKEGIISSKLEAGQWALSHLPKNLQDTIHKVVACYTGEKKLDRLTYEELFLLCDFIKGEVENMREGKG